MSRYDDLAWMEQARCLDIEPVCDTAKQAREFARHCLYCPVKAECLAHGLAIKANTMVFGGVWFNGDGIPNMRWTDHPVDDRDNT